MNYRERVESITVKILGKAYAALPAAALFAAKADAEIRGLTAKVAELEAKLTEWEKLSNIVRDANGIQYEPTSYSEYRKERAVLRADNTRLTAEVGRLRLALQAQAASSDMQKQDAMPNPDDPRYEPFIGKWDGYKAPELRWAEFQTKRRELREAALAQPTPAPQGEVERG